MIPSPYSLPAVSNGDIIALTTTVIPSTVINSTSYSNYIRPTAYVVSGSAAGVARLESHFCVCE